MPNAILIGKEETFKSLGLRSNQKISLEKLIRRLKKQFEKESHSVKVEVRETNEGLQTVEDLLPKKVRKFVPLKREEIYGR